MCVRHLGQYFFNSIRSGSFRRFLFVGYVRSRHSVLPSVINIRLSPLRAIYVVIPSDVPATAAVQDTRGVTPPVATSDRGFTLTLVLSRDPFSLDGRRLG